jgi:hypothetical protein
MPIESSTHHHQWATRSSHITSEGLLRYQQCLCGRWQVVIAGEVAVVGDVIHAPRRSGRTPALR